jgi:glutamate dehydrogenase (NAD(P)+)
MWKRYNAFLRRPPEIAVAWSDRETGARAWLIINTLRGGAAGGGTRMRAGLTPREVTYLAKAMQLKFALSGPAIGGAKNGIDFDPADPRKLQVLERWYRAIRPYLQECYGTGGDLNVDEVTEVIPTFRRLDLPHPQGGIVRGHIRPDTDRLRTILHALDDGVQAPIDDCHHVDGYDAVIADMITGYGVAASVRDFYASQGRKLDGVRVSIEGFGAVGGPCALYLTRWGARIVAITDAEKALLAPNGLAVDEVESLVRRRVNRLIPRDDPRIIWNADRQRLLAVPADVFVAAATSGSLDQAALDTLLKAGVKVIAGGANNPFREVKLGSTRLQQWADRRFSIIPDITANCGMARTFSYLMEDGACPSAAPIFAAVDRTIGDAVAEAVARSKDGVTNLLAATLDLALDRAGEA